jgi:hypothetical protein
MTEMMTFFWSDAGCMDAPPWVAGPSEQAMNQQICVFALGHGVAKP